jgi:hypothetical protein
MPSAETHTPAAPALEAFLAMTEVEQLERIDACAAAGHLAELLPLHDAYIRWAELHQHDPTARGWLCLPVLARLLDVLQPGDACTDGYREMAQDGRLRERLTPAALASLRQQSYHGTLAPLFTADDATRAVFIASLDPNQLRNLDTLLRRYATERDGRPHRDRTIRRAVRLMVAQRLAALKSVTRRRTR